MKTASETTYRCAACGRKLKHDHWVTGKDRRITGGKIPRYCWPGEGCHK